MTPPDPAAVLARWRAAQGPPQTTTGGLVNLQAVSALELANALSQQTTRVEALERERHEELGFLEVWSNALAVPRWVRDAMRTRRIALAAKEKP